MSGEALYKGLLLPRETNAHKEMTEVFLRKENTGFSVLELTVSVAVFAIIAFASAPSISEWIGKARVRTSAEALRDDIRLAQSEAVKRNQLVEFSLVDSAILPAADATAADDGSAWIIRVVPFSTEAVTVVRAGVFSGDGTQIKGGDNKTLVFDGIGQVYTSIPDSSNPDPLLQTTRAYQVTSSRSPYLACVLAQPGGAVRWCDPTIPSGDRSCPGSATQSCL